MFTVQSLILGNKLECLRLNPSLLFVGRAEVDMIKTGVLPK
jgi:hypothetical protein